MSDFLRIFRRIGVPVFCFVFAAVSLAGFTFERRFLLEPFASTQATVTTVEPQSHGQLWYTYTVDGNTFTGTGAGSTARGGKINVFFLLTDPFVSTQLDPSGGFPWLFGQALAGALFQSAFMSLAAYVYGQWVTARSRKTVHPVPRSTD